jgi:sensor histidine kinase YesM
MMKIRLGEMEISTTRYLALWSLIVLAFAVQKLLHDALLGGQVWSVFDYLRWSMIQWYSWAALAPSVFRLAARYPIQSPGHLSAVCVHLVAGLGMTSIAVIIGAAVSTLFEPSSFAEQVQQFIGQYVAAGLMTYWALVLVQHALHLQAEKSRREIEASQLATELARSRLQVLKTQLQPHFLFNTLHAIVTLLDEDKVSAEDMLLRLSELLRAFGGNWSCSTCISASSAIASRIA